MSNPGRPLAERFWKYVIPEPNTGCWLWMAAGNRHGYGRLGTAGRGSRRMLAHVISWTIHKGPVPEGMVVCHRCDVPWCVNPGHLFVATQADNLRDMFAKGRARPPRGERHCKSKLTEADVKEMFRLDSMGVTRTDIARRFGVASVTASHVLTRRIWKHITTEK